MLYFGAKGNDAFFGCVENKGNERKSEYISKKIYGIGNACVHYGKYGESAGNIGAQIEHINAFFGNVMVSCHVENKRYDGNNRENYHRPSKIAFA